MKKIDNEYIRKWQKKLKAIMYLGGKCSKCGETDIRVLEFHHKNEHLKKMELGKFFTCSWCSIQEEIIKCVLLCRNCHVEEHYVTSITSRDQINKNLILSFLNKRGCDICGYNSCNRALEFHHTRESLFKIGEITNRKRWKTISDIEDYIIDELSECSLLCSNHHKIEHIDGKFEKYKTEIFSDVIWRKNNKAPMDNILKLYNLGYKNSEISKEINVPLNTIKYVLDKNGLKKNE